MTPDHFGVIHGDFSLRNYNVNIDNLVEITVFDWNNMQRGWYLLDLGSLIFDAILTIQEVYSSMFSGQDEVKGLCI